MRYRLGELQSEDKSQSGDEEHDNEIVYTVVEIFVTRQVEELKEEIENLTDVVVDPKENITARVNGAQE